MHPDDFSALVQRSEANYASRQKAAPPKKATHGRGGFLTSLISELGGAGGALGGAAIGTAILPGVGTAIGAGLGGLLGGTGGSIAEQKVRDNKVDLKKAATEGAISGVTGAFTPGRAALKAARVGEQTVAKQGAKGILAKATGKFKTSAQDASNRNIGIKPGASVNGKIIGDRDVKSYMKFLHDEVGASHDVPADALRKVESYQKGKFAELQDLVESNNAKIRKSDVKGIVGGIKRPLGIKLEDNALHQDLLQEASQVKDLKGLEAFRHDVDDIVNYNRRSGTPDPATERVAKAWRTAIDKHVSNLLPESKTIKRSLSKSYDVQELLAKEAGKTPKNVNILGTTVPGSGQAKQYLASKVLPTLAGEGAPTAEAVTANVPTGILSRLGKPIGAQVATSSLFGPQDQAPSPEAPIPEVANPSPLTADQADNPAHPEQDTLDAQRQALDGAIMQALGNGDTKGLSNLLSVADYLDKRSQAQSAGGKGLNSTASGVIADTKTGLQSLGSLGDEIGSSSANNPIVGRLRGANPFDTNAQSLQANIATTKQIVGKALEGGVLRKEDEAKYAKLLPTMGDTDATARAKISKLTDLISSRLAEYESNLGGGGGTDLAGLGL